MKNKNLSGNLFTKKALTIKETPLSSSIAEWLDLHKIYNDRLNSGKVKVVKSYFNKTLQKWIDYDPYWMQLSQTGTPDRFAIVRGHIVFIEVKQLGKKPSTEQLAKHDELRKAGAIVLIVDSFDDFLFQFNEIKNKITKFS
ncbi:MAG TPA: hypothetical protein VIL74_20750 [Pyrinomonadaceae bacterium]|jgi:hypothetical protein